MTPPTPPSETPETEWVWWEKGDACVLGPRNQAAVAWVPNAEQAQAICLAINGAQRRLREAEAENKRILELHKGLMAEADRRLEAAERRVEREETDWSKLYHELLYAVGNKYPGETRHQTALRYIQNAERGSNQCDANSAAPKDDNEAASGYNLAKAAQDKNPCDT